MFSDSWLHPPPLFSPPSSSPTVPSIIVLAAAMSNPLRHCRTSELVIRLKTSIYNKGGSIPPPVATRLIFSNNALDDSSSYGTNGLVEGASCQLEWDAGIRVTIQMPKQEPVQVDIWPLEPVDEMKSRVLRQYCDNNELPATWVDQIFARGWYMLRAGEKVQLEPSTVGQNNIQPDEHIQFLAETKVFKSYDTHCCQLYFARRACHAAQKSTSQTVHRALRLTNSAPSTAPHKQCTEHCASQS